MSNDNRPHHKRPAVQWALFGIPDRPNDCPCGCDAVFVDGQNLHGRRGPFFVWCPACGRSGPERPSYNDALAVWNRITRNREYWLFNVVDNTNK